MGGNAVQTKTLKGTRQYEIESNNLLLLTYYIIEKSTSSYKKYYGIEINQQKIKEGVKRTIKYNSLLLSECKELVEEILDKFIGNGVTPETMTYIIDDIIEIPC